MTAENQHFPDLPCGKEESERIHTKPGAIRSVVSVSACIEPGRSWG